MNSVGPKERDSEKRSGVYVTDGPELSADRTFHDYLTLPLLHRYCTQGTYLTYLMCSALHGYLD